jgi:hypothetical protein
MTTAKEEVVGGASEDNSGYLDAFMGFANNYVSAKYSESSREQLEPANQAMGNTDTIYQPETGETEAGETIVVKPAGINVKKLAIYSTIGFGALVTLGVIYKVVK